ncbi:MAG: hypothetical protein WBX25_32750 [Rhodomicrobium sp.]
MTKLSKRSGVSCLEDSSSHLRAIGAGIVFLLIACSGYAYAQDPTSRLANTMESEIVILLLTIVVAAGLVFLRRVVFVFVVRALRLLIKPFSKLFRVLSKLAIRVLRSLRIVSKTPPKQKPVQVFTGLTVDAVARALTETDQAIVDGFEPSSVEIKRHKRLFCTWLAPDFRNDQYDKKLAESDFEKAKYFFAADVDINSNPLNLYDDINNAFIVRLFKNSDKTCFYVLSEFRKAITLNVVIISVIFSLIVSTVAVMNILDSNSIDFYGHLELGAAKYVPQSFTLFGSQIETSSVINKLLFGILSCFFGFGLMLFFYHISYEQFQRLNGQQMNNFLVRYLAEVNINFAQIQANATRAVVEDKDLQEIKKDTVLWITNLQWMAFRAFFIEQYLRSIMFQVRRNSIYTLLLIPLFFVILMLITSYLFNIKEFNVFNLGSSVYHQNSFYLVFAWLLFAYHQYLTSSLAPLSESIEGRWSNFRELNILNAMTTIMESYATQLDQWRSRFRDRSGGPGSGL